MKKLLLASFALCAAQLPAQDRDFDATVETTLSKVRRDADAFRNVSVMFVAQFASLGKMTNPFFTRFTPTDYTNFYVWADEQPIWQRGAYEDLFGNLFYPKSGPQLEEVFELRTYQRMRITGIVRNTFQDQPWIEVTDFELLPDRVNAGVLSHMYRGEQFMAERRWQRAIAELSRVPESDVPDQVARAAHRNLGICYLRIGEAGQAVNSLRSAAALSETHDAELEMLLATAENDPSLELDRVVGQEGLKDYERPMWEAFEEGRAASQR